MLSEFLKKNIKSQAGFIQANGYGYGQVEPNHLSGQATKEVYAQLPAKKDIEILENGQFAKYNYADEVVDFDGPGEWMLVYNEIKLYRDHQIDAEFAMIRDNYQARVYSPFGGEKYGNSPDTTWTKQSRYYNGQGVSAADGSITFDNQNGTVSFGDKTFPIDDVTAAPDIYEIHYNEDPFHIESLYKEKLMPENGSSMVPRLIKTHVGDIFTTNMIKDASVALKAKLVPGAKGILEVKATPAATDMVWQVVKVYTMPDHQPGVKVMRIQ
ncbi:MAG: hypothetical protein IJ880_09075 [Bacilli bacterium]|nr:hypothetical protein [Bacilli bacterium]